MKKRSLGISLQYINTFMNMICGLFLSAYLLRSLGDTEYGIYQTISSFVNYLVLLEFGTGTVLARNISLCNAKKDQSGIQKNTSTLLGITCVLIGIIVIVGLVFYCFLDTIYSSSLTHDQIRYGKKIFLVALGYLIISFYSNAISGILLGFEKYEIQPIISIIKIIVRTLLLIVIILIINKSIIIAVIDLILAFIINTYLIIYCKKTLKIKMSFKFFDWQIFKSSLPLSIAIFIQVLINQANNNVDKFIIGIKIGPEEVTLYSVGLYVYSIFSSLTTIPITMYGPQVVKEIASGNTPDEVSKHLIQPSRLIILIGGTILFGFFSVGKQFISLVYGPSYILAWIIALIIMVPMLINMSNGIMINILDATDKRMARSGILLLSTTANIILTVIWIERYGSLGACIATAVCTIVGQVLLMDFYYYSKLHIHVLSFKIQTFKGIVVYQTIASITAYFIGSIIPSTLISLIVGGIIYIIIFLYLFLMFGASDIEKKKSKVLFDKISGLLKRN